MHRVPIALRKKVSEMMDVSEKTVIVATPTAAGHNVYLLALCNPTAAVGYQAQGRLLVTPRGSVGRNQTR